MTRRRGISLSELMVSVSLVAMTLPLSGKLLWTLANAQRSESRAADERREFSRLVFQLKTDSLAAERMVLQPQPHFDQRDQSKIQYIAHPQGTDRLVERDGKVVHRDTFRMGSERKLEFAADAVSRKAVVRVTTAATGTKAIPLRLPLRVSEGTAP